MGLSTKPAEEQALLDGRVSEEQAEDHSPDQKAGDCIEMSLARKHAIVGALVVSVFLPSCDTSIVATLMVVIGDEFQATQQASWLGTSYLMSLALCSPIYGRLSGIFGRRFSFLFALSLFAAGTVGCGSAGSLGSLIFFRFMSGAGASGLNSTNTLILSDLFSLRDRGVYQSVLNVAFSIGASLGGLLGGFVHEKVGWRFAFLGQIPVMSLAGILAVILLRYEKPKAKQETLRQGIQRIDFIGALTLAVALGSFLLALAFKVNELKEWSSPPVYISCLLSALFFPIFLYTQQYISKEPVLPLRMLRSRATICIFTAMLVQPAIGFSLVYYYTQWFQTVLQRSATEAGSHLVPNAIAIALGSIVAGLYMRRTGRYHNAAILSACSIMLAFVMMSCLDQNSNAFVTWIAVIPSGFGATALLTLMQTAILVTITSEDKAVATSISYLFRYTGSLLGVALSGAIEQWVLAKELRRRITGDGAAAVIDAVRHEASSIATLPAHLKVEAIASYEVALHSVFMWDLGLAILLICICCFIREVRLV